MTVLTKIVKERADWSNQQRIVEQRYNHIKVVIEYMTLALLCILPCLAYAYRDKILVILHKFMN